jgi:hypothetical protein
LAFYLKNTPLITPFEVCSTTFVIAYIRYTGGTIVDKKIDFYTPAIYRIQLKENLRSDWNEWFSGFEVTQEVNSSGSLLTGMVTDQAALHGLIRKVRDLGLTLVSIQRMETKSEKPEKGEQNDYCI